MKIKIKIKTLILLMAVLVITIVWVIPTTTLVIAKAVDRDKASYFYEKYVSYPTTSNIKGNYQYAKSLITFHEKFTIYHNAWGGGDMTKAEDIKKLKTALLNIMKESPNNIEQKYYQESYKMLLDFAIQTGDVQLLKEWISFGQNSNDEYLIYVSNIYHGFFLHVNGDRESANKILDKYEDSEIKDVHLDILKAEILLFDGNYQEAKELYRDITKNNWYAHEQGNFGSGEYFHRDFWFSEVMDDAKGDNIIRGTVTYEGEPIPFVEIYLQRPDGGISIGGESYIGITDEYGRFETLGLKDGEYSIGLGLQNLLLADKALHRSVKDYLTLDGSDGEINFEFKDTIEIKTPKHGETISGDEFTVSWEEVKGADYYTVSMVSLSQHFGEGGAVFWHPSFDENGESKHRSTSATVNIEALKDEIGGYGLDEDSIKTPNAFLGLFIPGLEHPIIVNAYDESENQINSSLGFRSYYDQMPSITVEGSITEGEELIANQEYPQAIEYYENILKEEPDDIAALRYLTKLYGIGWKDGEENIDRAMELGERYSELVGSRRLLDIIVDINY